MIKKNRNPSQPPGPGSTDSRRVRPEEAGVPEGQFYASRWEDAESIRRLLGAASVRGIDEELAILRWRLDELLAQKDKDDPLISKIIGLIVRVYAVKASAADASSSAPDGKAIEDFLKGAIDKFGLEKIPWDSNC